MTFANVTSDEHLCKGSLPFSFFFQYTRKPDIPLNHQTECSFSTCHFGIFGIVMKCFSMSFYQTKCVNTSVIVENFRKRRCDVRGGYPAHQTGMESFN